MRPAIGITVDNRGNNSRSGTYESAIRYSQAVNAADGVPLLLPHEIDRIHDFVDRCDAVLLSGGADPDTRAFEEPLHPLARRMDPGRQAFELGLLEELRHRRPQVPVLGVCLGMQLMALNAGGRLNQYLPDILPNAQLHAADRRHPVSFRVDDSVLPAEDGPVVSSHQQAVEHPGSLRVVAVAPDGIIEAIDDPMRHFYLGVQWHPERGNGSSALNFGLIENFVGAAQCSS